MTAASGGRRVVFFSDNGHGLGHITRLMAIARRLPSDLHPVFLTLSPSHSLVREQGFPTEYFPSPKALGLSPEDWAAKRFHLRMTHLFERLQPVAVVIDHVSPPTILRKVKAENPTIALVWIRRGLWQPRRNLGALRMSDVFDLIIEPTDVASPLDHGHTVRTRDVTYVPPVTLLDPEELLDRTAARSALGLPKDGLAVLLQLSADSPEALHRLQERARDLIRSLEPEASVFAPLHPLHAHVLPSPRSIRRAPVYPISRYLRAFDAAISTAGYNSFHELVMAAVPTLFVARETASLDDQDRRAATLRQLGGGLHVGRLRTDDATAAAVRALMDERERERLHVAARTVYPGNGASQAAEAIALLARAHSAVSLNRKYATQSEAHSQASGSSQALVTALDYDSSRLDGLVRWLRAQPGRGHSVLLVGPVDTRPLSAAGIVFETVLDETSWKRLGLGGTYATYVESRIRDVCGLHQLRGTIRADPAITDLAT